MVFEPCDVGWLGLAVSSTFRTYEVLVNLVKIIYTIKVIYLCSDHHHRWRQLLLIFALRYSLAKDLYVTRVSVAS